jgi:hypothetical protein
MSNSCDVHDFFWPAEPLSPTAGAGQAGSYAFAESDSFLLRDRGENGDHRILEDPAGIEVRLGETAITDAGPSQAAYLAMYELTSMRALAGSPIRSLAELSPGMREPLLRMKFS